LQGFSQATGGQSHDGQLVAASLDDQQGVNRSRTPVESAFLAPSLWERFLGVMSRLRCQLKGASGFSARENWDEDKDANKFSGGSEISLVDTALAGRRQVCF
jgi:hypothetical protein